ncbi:HYR domain-containing protein [Maribacter sp. 2210JD10-5]|uniref:HYR domain-containing protein n=1 Tax=Maribacter sp. 2210JD10-5 TaxID=3386272 RepID=UPI0039BC4069
MRTPIRNLFFSIFILALFSCVGSKIGEEVPEDTVNPTINCLETINLTIDAFASEVVVDYEAPKGSDNLEGATTGQIAGLSSGSSFPVGTTTNTFEVRDAAGNKATCSFDVVVTRGEPSSDLPYFVGDNPTTGGKKWVKVDDMSDEFNNDTFDDEKWHRNTATDGFGWIGRPPGLFESENVTVSDGNLNVTTVKFDSPKMVNGNTFTHGGAIVRSKKTGNAGMYYECRMKANKTVMSSTFWLSMKQNCTTGPIRKLELDIQECVGRTHDDTAVWAKNWDQIFHSNTFRHNRDCDTEVNETQQISGKTDLSEKNYDRFFVYGCWWKSPTEILFYIDGEYAYSITPPTDFDIDGHITMAIETYDWNPIDLSGSIFETGSFDDLTTKYDWVRTWRLEDE